MHKTSLRVLGLSAAAFALTMLAASVSNVSAEMAPKPPACNTLKEEMACKALDCSWVSAVVDSKTGKEKRKAYCRKKPAEKKKKDKS